MEAKTIGNMKFYDFEDILDQEIGTPGTPARDKFDADVDEAVNAYKMGEAIKKARVSKNLTQEQLGEMIGVKKSQVSRIESGRNLTFSTIARVFKAMGISVSFDMSGVGKVALW